MRVSMVALLLLALVASSIAIRICFHPSTSTCSGSGGCVNCDASDSCCRFGDSADSLTFTVGETGSGDDTTYSFNTCNDACTICSPECVGPSGTCCANAFGSFRISDASSNAVAGALLAVVAAGVAVVM